MLNDSFERYHEVGASSSLPGRNVGERSSAGRGRFANGIPLRIDTYNSWFRREPGSTMTETVAGTVSRSTFGRSGTYTLKCNLNPLALDANKLNKRKCIYEKSVTTHPGMAKSATLHTWHNPQSRLSVVGEPPVVDEGQNNISSMMW